MKNFTDLDCYLFGQATHYDIYEKMGAHVKTRNKKKASSKLIVRARKR